MHYSANHCANRSVKVGGDALLLLQVFIRLFTQLSTHLCPFQNRKICKLWRVSTGFLYIIVEQSILYRSHYQRLPIFLYNTVLSEYPISQLILIQAYRVLDRNSHTVAYTKSVQNENAFF